MNKENLIHSIRFWCTALKRAGFAPEAIKAICLNATNGTPSNECSIYQLKDCRHFLWVELLSSRFQEIQKISRENKWPSY